MDADVERFLADTVLALHACMTEQRRPAVACTDFRATTLLRPEAAEKIVALMKRDNPNVERNGILIAKSANVALQVTRLLREALSESRRRLFTDVEPLGAWLDESLNTDERARLRAFIAEPEPKPEW